LNGKGPIVNVRKIVVSLGAVVLICAGCQSLSQSRVEKERVLAMQELKHLALGCHLYAEDNDGLLPGAMADLKPYLGGTFDPDAYELLVSGKLGDVERPAKTILIRQKEPLADGRYAVAFVDGHAEIVFTGGRRGDVPPAGTVTPAHYAELRTAEQHAVITEDWGSLCWLASRKIGNAEGLVLGRATIKAGKTNPRHRHPKAEEVLYLLKGSIKHTLDDRTIVVHAGDTITIAPGVFHNATCISEEDADMIIVYSEGVRGFELE
jgi:quercetin dioxygenase-like cupin family protein